MTTEKNVNSDLKEVVQKKNFFKICNTVKKIPYKQGFLSLYSFTVHMVYITNF